MLRSLGVTGVVVSVVAGLALGSAQAAITVDGNLSDWGVAVADNNGSNQNNMNLQGPSIGLVNKMIEDQNDLAGHRAFLGPRYGGQDYDAELMAVAYRAGLLYIAIETGQRPDNGFNFFGPGDIRIKTSGGIYGLEVGGGQGGAMPGSAITEGALGSTYSLFSNGETLSYANAAAAQTAGSIWKNVQWLNSPFFPNLPTQVQIHSGSTLVGAADYVYTRNSQTTQHAVIELGLNVPLFNGELIKSVTWRPACGNDELNVPVDIVPEPATLAFLAAGALAFRPRRRRTA
jgi:hypothetical protein